MISEYVWIFVVGSLGAFGFGWGTGANDVANAFGTSVGSKTITLKQAVVLASIFEFGGALILGRVSTSTIAGGIANIDTFVSNPMVYAYGMMCNLLIGTLWLAIASYKGWNVSSTHSIIGGIIGFSLVYAGKDGVAWAIPDDSGKSFPPYKGVIPIVLSWFVSPILTGLASAFIFVSTRQLVLRRENAYRLSYYVLPLFVLITTWINIYFVFTKGAKKTLQNQDDWTDAKAAWITTIIASGSSAISGFIGIPLLKRHIETRCTAEEAGVSIQEVEAPPVSTKSSIFDKTKQLLLNGVEQDIHKVVEEDPLVASIHANAELFDPKVEGVFKYLQLMSAICVIFAHGAGEVGYMAGPLSSIWHIVNTNQIEKSTEAPIWIIVIGASGLVVGLATYGYRVTEAVGTRLSKITASRGFAAELATSLVIMIASQYGLPTSSSQCITGGIIGVGAVEGLKGVNWRFFATTVLSWINTMFFIGLGVGAVFAQGIYAPHRD
jgi:sodium-dependent phosphate transporter